jgi:hypothetical protein
MRTRYAPVQTGRVLEFTGEYCDVSPFSKEYEPLANVPVAKCATVYTCDDTGALVLLVADQVLWFGDQMSNSLINPINCEPTDYVFATIRGTPTEPLELRRVTFSSRFTLRGRICSLNRDPRLPGS